MLAVEFEAYAPVADNIAWLHEADRETGRDEIERPMTRGRRQYLRKKARMDADPVYRERELAKARENTRRYRERHYDRVVQERRRSDRRRYAANNAEIRRRSRELYVGERAARIRARNREGYARNREQRKAQRRRYRADHLEELRARERLREREKYARDPQAVLGYYRTWRVQNIDRARAYVRVSDHKRRAASGSFTATEWFALVAAWNGRCAYCGRVGPLEADHRLPLCRGGTNTIDNILPACVSCNRRKHRKTEAEFRAILASRPLDQGGVVGEGRGP